MKYRIVLAALATSLLASLPAKAVVTVYGMGRAHECFLAAKAPTRPDNGIAICDTALKEDPLNARDRAATFVNRGVLKNVKGLHDEAMADYETGIRINPDLGDAYVDRGAVLISLKRYDEALADINKGIELGVSLPHIGYYNRAVAQFYRNEFTASYYDFKKVLEIDPSFTQATEQLKNFIVTRKPAGT